MSNPRFSEKQVAYRQPWILLMSIACMGILIGMFIYQVITGIPVGDKPMSDTGYLVMIVLLGGLFGVLLSATLQLEMDEQGIRYRFWPFVGRWVSQSWHDMESVEVRSYRPLLEYGGWGYRYGLKGRALTLGGRVGVQLTNKSGKRLLIGVDNDTEAARVIAHYKRRPDQD